MKRRRSRDVVLVHVPRDQAPLFHVPGPHGGWFISLLYGFGLVSDAPMQELRKLLAGSRGEVILARRLTRGRRMYLSAGERTVTSWPPITARRSCSSARPTSCLPLRAEGLGPVTEDNDAMTSSYVMVDPLGRFYGNAAGRYVYSDPILSVGVDVALAQVGWEPDRFVNRGGVYDWSARRDRRLVSLRRR